MTSAKTILSVIGALAALLCAPAPAGAVEATLKVDIPAGKWKSVRLKSLPRGTSLDLKIESSGPVRVILVDSVELRKFPNTRALFEAAMEKKLAFKVVIPRGGDYFVVFDNRQSAQAPQITLNIKAQAPSPASPVVPKPPRRDETRRMHQPAVPV